MINFIEPFILWVNGALSYLSLLYLCFCIFARFGGYEERGCWFVQESISLALNVCCYDNIT